MIKRALMSLALLTAGAAAVMPARAETEEPSFTVVDSFGAVEVRQYGPRLAAEVVVAGDEEDARSAGFRLLADFIFGNNTSKLQIAMTAPVAQVRREEIAMTAPVATERDEKGWRVRFFMPAKYTLSTLPRPNDPRVHIVELPAITMAVRRFSNSRSAEAVARQTAELLHEIEVSHWSAVGPPVAWFYDPPWTLPFFRRNEVAVAVTARR